MRRHVINALAASALVSVIASGCAGGGDATDGVAPDAGDDGSVSGSSSGGGSGSGSGGSSGGGSGGGAVDSGGIDAAGIDAGALQTCVHTDDCKPPAAMCQGNNGVACLGGFCVPTGHPMSCDDGIACTDDFCDANANACTHKPDDAACPNGSYCDPTLNCVQTLPCTPGDAVCDRLDTGACNGLWTCDPTAKHCVHGAKPCPDRPNATTTCAPSGGLDGGVVADAGAASAECAWACAPSFVDLDGDLENPVGAPSDGCECAITNAVDVPDLGFVDSNCDGIDGDVTKAIFVDGASGKDSNPGTMAAPMKTVGAGLAAAASASPKKSVYVSKGSYDEGTLTLLDGVSLYGGYDAASHWSRANDFAHTTTIASTSNVAVLGKGLGGALELQLFAITAQGGAAPGDSSYGVKLVNASGGVTLRALTITPGPGANAGPAQSGGTAADGVTGNDAKGTAHGGDLGSSCNAGSGGAGGDGVCGETDGNPGILGGTATLGGAQGASPGTGGGKGHCPFIGTSGPGAPGNTPLQPGQSGGPGANGNPGGAVGSFDSASGDYSPATGGAGVAGNPGGGGAGGGAGGGSASHDPISCNNHCSGGGGGGGTGGCGGNPGLGGLGGGGSFAVVMLGSQVLLDQCKLNPGAGGTGSNGGDGGQGGKGGPGGKAGGADGNAGSGAPGGAGGSGGRGGGGAGGPGGPSVCVGYKGSPPAGTSAYVCNLSGSTSGGGQGGTGGLGRAASGPSGVQADKQQGQ